MLKIFYYAVFTPLARILGALGLWGLDMKFRDPDTASYWRPVGRATVPRLPRKARRKKARYSPHHYSLYWTTPGYRAPGGALSHNALGFRGSEIAFCKPDGVFRIVCIGESTTYCTNIEDNEATYPGRLQHHLRHGHGLPYVEVINAGVGGYTSAENLIHYLFRVQPLSADLVLYYFTHNDVHPRRHPLLSRDYREYCKVWTGRGNTRGRDIGSLVRTTDETPNRLAANTTHNPGTFFRDNLTSLAALVETWGGRLVFILPPYRGINPDGTIASENPVHHAVWEHREIARKLCLDRNLPFFDLARVLPPPPIGRNTKNEHFLDAVHFSEKGADEAARAIAAYLADNVLQDMATQNTTRLERPPAP